MLFEGTDLSDEQLENMRNSDDYRELVKKFRDRWHNSRLNH